MLKKAQARSLGTILLRGQFFIGLLVLGIVTSILLFMLLAFANYVDHQRTLELAQSIETQSSIAKSPQDLQYALTQIVSAKRAESIVLYRRKDNKVIAANTDLSGAAHRRWIVADNEIGKLITSNMQKGIFGLHFTDHNNRRIAMLPLGPVSTKLENNNVNLGAERSIPAWHKKAALKGFSVTIAWERMSAIFNPDHQHNFHLKPDEYSGAIVIETSRDWIAKLIFWGAISIAALMAISFIIMLAMLSYALRKNVLRPVQLYIETISARRGGNSKARAPLFNIEEFDELAHQWNSLLDFRDVAQGQNILLSTLLEHVPVGIDVTDITSKIEYANPNFLTMTGYSLSEVIGQTPDFLLASSKMDHAVLGNALVAITNGETWCGEVTYSRKDGSDLVCNTTFVPIIGRTGKVERLISVRLDITKLRDDESDLITAKINAETADLAKSEFLSNMSHELRTPLNAIIGFSEMMADQRLGPIGNNEYVEFAKLIETSSRTLLSSISLILDVARLDANTLQLNQTTFCVSEMLHKLIESKIDMARSMGVEVKRNLDCQHRVRTDQRMLHQTIGYLINNAIRYNKSGGQVFVNVREDDGKTIVSIKDTGIGISKENLKKVTMPFFRVDSSHARMKDGAGLGLTLVKKFADQQKMDFKIISELNYGTTVTLTLPIVQTETTNLVQPKLQQLKSELPRQAVQS